MIATSNFQAMTRFVDTVVLGWTAFSWSTLAEDGCRSWDENQFLSFWCRSPVAVRSRPRYALWKHDILVLGAGACWMLGASFRSELSGVSAAAVPRWHWRNTCVLDLFLNIDCMVHLEAILLIHGKEGWNHHLRCCSATTQESGCYAPRLSNIASIAPVITFVVLSDHFTPSEIPLETCYKLSSNISHNF